MRQPFRQENALGVLVAGATPDMGLTSAGGGFFDSPDTQRPLYHPWGAGRMQEGGPTSAMREKAHFSPYSSQYSSPVLASEQMQIIGKEWPTDRKGSLGGGGLGRVGSISQEQREKGVGFERDLIEMHKVPPVLFHHGDRRGGSLGLTEGDARRSDAL